MRVLALLLLCATLAARPPANLAHVLRENPLYPQLVHYDRAIAALSSAETRWQAQLRAIEIARARIALDDAFDGASAELRRIADSAPAYERREGAALQHLRTLTVPPVRLPPDTASLALAQLRESYRRRVNDAYEERSRQLQEGTSTLALQLTRRDAHRISMLQIRARDLGLDRHDSRAAVSQLDAIYQAETAQLAAADARNARVLAAYRAVLLRSASAQERRAAEQIERRIAANRAARESAAPPIPAALRNDVRSFAASSNAATRLGATLEAFRKARAALDRRFASVEATDEASLRAAMAQRALLQRERDELRGEIVAWITYCATPQAPRPRLECATPARSR